MLAPVRESFRSGVPIEWQRVHDLPDFVYFNHSIHVNKGVACETCHGAVDQMPLMWQEATLHMDWCLECHRDPGAFVRPPGHVFDFWHGSPPADALAIDGAAALAAHGVEPVGTELTNCTACHR